jgi:signal peptidase I
MSIQAHMPNDGLMARLDSPVRTARRPYHGRHSLSIKLLQLVLLVLLACASYLFISRFVVGSVQVVGESMMPSLRNAQHLLLNRWIYYLRLPRAGDIVVFHDPIDHQLAVKRVIGVPGDVVDLKGGCVYLNGRKLSEPYLALNTPTFPFMNRKTQSFVCDQGHYLVLGDNRKNSADSRTYGLVSDKAILGRIVR